MAALLCFGFGYSAEHYAGMFGDRFDRIVGTVRNAERAAALRERIGARIEVLVFDGKLATPELHEAIGAADCVLVSTPPDEQGDPALAVCADHLAEARDLRSIVYLSTIGVYGDRGGGWVDEKTPPEPASARSHARVAAEAAWQALGAKTGGAVAVLRLAGVYGPGQNALVQVARGNARRIVKPGQIFNRIHVDDIAQSIEAAFARRAAGVFNVADDEPTPAGDPIVLAAELLGRAPPPEVTFAEAAGTMSPMGLSFWQECRRVRNDKLKRQLGVALRYPTYREGLRALSAASGSVQAG